jgi:transcriptional regulator with XRE-family HTH domain
VNETSEQKTDAGSGLGERIRRLRLGRHMSLGDLTTLVNISRSFLSQVEQGKTMPSVTTLKSIANGLNVTVGSLIDEPPEMTCPVIRSNNRPKIEHLQSGVTLEALTCRDMHKVMEPFFIRLQAHASSGNEGYSHRGQEFGIVIQGSMQVQVDGIQYDLNEGDSIYFDSTRSHRFVNPGDIETLAMWVISPPTF